MTVASLFVLAACSNGATPTPTPSASTAASQAAASQPAASTGSSPAASTGGSAAAGGAPECVTGSVTAAGSTALQPLVDKAGKDYAAACPGAAISVQGGGSGTGLTQVSQGAVQIGNSDVTAESKNITGLTDHIIAKQGWLMVANNDVTGITNLSTQQMSDIWTGKTTNWSTVGGPNEPIVLILRPDSSGTRATFKTIVLNGAQEATGQALTVDSNGAVADAVKATPGSTSVLAYAYFAANQGQMVGFGLDGVQISVGTMKDGTYKLAAEGHMYTKGDATGLAKSFIDYILGPTVQGTTIPALYYAPVK